LARAARITVRPSYRRQGNFADALRETDHRDPDFALLLAEVRASRLFSVDEIAELVGLSRSRVYELVNEGARASREPRQ
jgi:hypothetical protein